MPKIYYFQEIFLQQINENLDGKNKDNFLDDTVNYQTNPRCIPSSFFTVGKLCRLGGVFAIKPYNYNKIILWVYAGYWYMSRLPTGIIITIL